jgi:hypothetical protein
MQSPAARRGKRVNGHGSSLYLTVCWMFLCPSAVGPACRGRHWRAWSRRHGAERSGGLLTDDDLDVINERQEQVEGKIQERYGLAKDQALLRRYGRRSKISSPSQPCGDLSKDSF